MDRQSQFRLALWAVMGILLGTSACEALYGNDRRDNEEYCEQDSTCTGEGKRCDPVLHRCTSVTVCLAGATYCWDDQAPVCQGDAKPCGGCTDSAQCLERWNTGYRNGTGVERTTCFKPASASVGSCAECGEDGRQDMRCPSARPVCIAGSCQACSRHDQCGSGICRTEEAFQESATAPLGSCVDDTLVTGVQTAAQLGVALGDPAKPFIKLATGDYGDVTVTQAGARILLGQGEPNLSGGVSATDQPRVQSIRATGDSRLTLSRLRIAPTSPKTALTCDSTAALYVRDTVIAGRDSPVLLESEGLLGSCRLVDLQRVYMRRVLRAITLQGNVQYTFLNLGITDSGTSSTTKPLITLAGSGTFAYASIQYYVLGSIVCGGSARLRYSTLPNHLTNAATCLDGAGTDSALLFKDECFLTTDSCSAPCRTQGLSAPSLVPATDFFGTSRVSPGTVARCGWYQPPAS